MRPTTEDLLGAITTLEITIPYFPKPGTPEGELHRELILEDLREMVSTGAQLTWLVKQCRRTMPKWTSCADLRKLFCSRFAPADGDSSIEDAERLFFEREARDTQQRLEQYRAEWRADRLLGSAEFKPLLLPAPIKAIPPLTSHSRLEAVQAASPGLKSALRDATFGFGARPDHPLAEKRTADGHYVLAEKARPRTPEENAAIVDELERRLKAAS